MKINEFDELIREKFEQTEFAYNPAHWQKLTHELQPSNGIHVIKTNWVRTMGIAASLLLAVAAFAWLFVHNAKDDKVASAPVKNAAPATVHSKEEVPTPPANTGEDHDIAQTSPATPATPAKARTSATIQRNPEPVYQSPAPQVVREPEQAIAKEETPVKNEVAVQPAPNKTFINNDPFRPEPIAPQSQGGKTHFSITGGMNYGSLNTGYTAGVNARQKIGRKLYIEGDLSIVSNNVDHTSNVTPTQYDAFNSGAAGKSPESNTLTQVPSNFLYVQFNPSLGYQVHKKISLSLGADLQRLLDHNGDVKTLVLQSDELKLIPGLDVGLTGKTEYAVTKKLRAGVLYREGINNLLKGTSEYFDRRYLQVQLKFTVFGR